MLANGPQGAKPTIAQVEGKWKTLVTAYRRTRDHNSKSGNNRKECAFQADLDLVLGDNASSRPASLVVAGRQMQMDDSAANRALDDTLFSQTAASLPVSVTPTKRKAHVHGNESSKKKLTEKREKSAHTLQKTLEDTRAKSIAAADTRHNEKMEKITTLTNVLERLVDKL